MILSRRFMAVGRQQLPQQDNFGRLNGVSLKNEEMHLSREQQKAAFALVNGSDQAPAFGRLDVNCGLENRGIDRAAEQPRFEHLDAILFHDLTMTSQDGSSNS